MQYKEHKYYGINSHFRISVFMIKYLIFGRLEYLTYSIFSFCNLSYIIISSNSRTWYHYSNEFFGFLGAQSAQNVYGLSVDVLSVLKGGSPLKISKTWFRNSDGPKRSTQSANFLVGFGNSRPLRAWVVTTPIFPPKIAQKIKKKNKHHTLDFPYF